MTYKKFHIEKARYKEVIFADNKFYMYDNMNVTTNGKAVLDGRDKNADLQGEQRIMNECEEKILKIYFEVKTVLGDALGAGKNKQLFCDLCRIFMAREASVESLYRMAEDDEVDEIAEDGQYKRTMRMIQYAKLNGKKSGLSEEQIRAIKLKGEALYTLSEARLLDNSHSLSGAESLVRVTRLAREGNATAMLIYALAQEIGASAPLNKDEERSVLERLTRWVYPEGYLIALRYGFGDKDVMLSRLYTVTRDMPEAFLYDMAKKRYGGSEDVLDEELALLVNAAEKGVVKRGEYSARFARIAFGTTITLRDKQRAIMGGGDAAAHVSALPLKMDVKRRKIRFKEELETAFCRREEQKRLGAFISSQALATLGKMRVVADDLYLQEEYIRAIERSVTDCNVKAFDFNRLSDEALENNFFNVFLKSINENKQNLFIVSVNGKQDTERLKKLSPLLGGRLGRKLIVSPLNVEFDMSGVTVIIFTDSYDLLKDDCITMALAPVSDEEKRAVLSDAFDVLKSAYGAEELAIEAGVAEAVGRLPLAGAVRLLERAVQEACLMASDALTLASVEQLKRDIDGAKRTFGFGGGNYVSVQ